MRILLCSHVFAPSVGGIETVSALLAGEFVRQGHEVQLVTQTPGEGPDDFGYPVHRRPAAAKLLRLVRWCDVYFHNNISLPRAWPLLLVRRPWVVAHHVWIPRARLAGRLKRRALRHAAGISVSQAIAADLETPSVVIPNPYDDRLFRGVADIARDRDVVFVGRLVSDKGAAVLLAALATLRDRGLRPSASIVGDGPESGALRRQVANLGIADTVAFTGVLRGDRLVHLLNAHRVLVAPSLWQEPFGLVALEGMACGCVPVTSDGGGLPEAVGGCGLTVPAGDSNALADALEQLLRDPSLGERLRTRAQPHLRRHRRADVAKAYLDVLEHAAGRRAQADGPRRVSGV